MNRISARNDRVFTDSCFPATAARFCWCVASSVGFAAPKALASPTSKFLSPLRGFVAPFGSHSPCHDHDMKREILCFSIFSTHFSPSLTHFSTHFSPFLTHFSTHFGMIHEATCLEYRVSTIYLAVLTMASMMHRRDAGRHVPHRRRDANATSATAGRRRYRSTAGRRRHTK